MCWERVLELIFWRAFFQVFLKTFSDLLSFNFFVKVFQKKRKDKKILTYSRLSFANQQYVISSYIKKPFNNRVFNNKHPIVNPKLILQFLTFVGLVASHKNMLHHCLACKLLPWGACKHQGIR